MKDILIIGNGPAGVSASLYTARAEIRTTIIGKDNGSLSKAEKIENYYGFEKPINGEDLVSKGISQAKRLGIKFIKEEVISLDYNFNEQFNIKTNLSNYKCDAVIIATGSPRTKPKIKNLEKFEGHGVSYCAVCDAFFYKGKEVSVLGYNEYALNEVKELLPIAKSVTLITNGMNQAKDLPKDLKVITKNIDSLDGDKKLNQIKFSDGTTLKTEGLFVAYGTANSIDLARKLGIKIKENKIDIDETMSTNIPGIFAAGDCTGGILQIAKAVYEGAKAGFSAIKHIRQNP